MKVLKSSEAFKTLLSGHQTRDHLKASPASKPLEDLSRAVTVKQ